MNKTFRPTFIISRRISAGLSRINDKWRIHRVLCKLDGSGKD